MENYQEIPDYYKRPLKFTEWALHIFLAGLPLVGIILLLVWAFGNDGNVHRKEWAKGMLLLYVIGIALAILFFMFFGATMLTFMNS